MYIIAISCVKTTRPIPSWLALRALRIFFSDSYMLTCACACVSVFMCACMHASMSSFSSVHLQHKSFKKINYNYGASKHKLEITQ